MRSFAAALIATLLFSGSAQAATHVINVTMTLPVGPVMDMGTVSVMLPPFSVASGDTIDITVDFAGDQEIVSETLYEIFLGAGHGTALVPVTNTGTLTFLDLAGAPIFATPENTYTACCAYAGGLIYDFGAAPLPLRYGGLRYVGTVEFADSGPYTLSFVNFSPTGYGDITAPGMVPEPAAWALMIGGFALAGARLRRRAMATA